MADLSNFATKDRAEEGVILPVKIDGVKFPMAVKVFGSDSDVVTEYERGRIRKLGIGKNGKEGIDEDDIEELLDDDEGVLCRIGGVYAYDWRKKKVIEGEDTVIDGIVIKDDRKSYEFLIEKIPAIKDWVKKASNERSNFFATGKKN